MPPKLRHILLLLATCPSNKRIEMIERGMLWANGNPYIINENIDSAWDELWVELLHVKFLLKN